MTKRYGRNDKIDKELGARIRGYRQTLKLTQEALGGKLGVTFQQIQKYESGANSVSSSRVPSLCRALKITPNELFDIR